MRNVIILGSGRSGTSMVAGVLANCGYYMGENLHPGRDSNPKGFFESPLINWINEELLAQVVPRRPPILGRWWFRDRPLPRQRWLARVPVGTLIPCPHPIATRIQAQVDRTPFCFKDPRFSYTLPAWRPYLADTVFVCVFRHPMATAASIVKECQAMPYLRNLRMNTESAVEVWALMYEHILRRHRQEGQWLFLHFDQVLRGNGADRLEEFIGAPVDRSFPETELQRSAASGTGPTAVMQVYQELCTQAGCEQG
ncbi:MAG: sulfotransferase [Phycisphaerales bacterium]|nr:MAG: sulfotransferase [Phycisphaerales bacterium]